MSSIRNPEKSALEFKDLPEELVLEIISNMLPEEILAQKSVSRNFYRLASDQLLWKRMMQIHFPHIVKKLKQNVDWPSVFKESYLEEYKNIPKNKRSLFSMAKQGRIIPLTKIEMEDLDLKDTKCNSPIEWAAKNKNQNVLNHFFTTFILPYYKHDPKGRSILFQAAKYGQINLVNNALTKRANKANINKANYLGATPLFVAAQNGHFEVVTSLLAAGADVNQAANNSATPLFIAAYNGHLKVVTGLLAASADVNKRANHGGTPLHIAAYEGHQEIVTTLLAAGADVNKAEIDGATPLFIAAQNGHFEVVTSLLAAGADVNQAANNGTTPLYLAAQNGHLEIAIVLLAAGADVKKAEIDGATPLYIAAQNGHLSIATTLLAAGANANEKTYSGTTPLYAAALNGHREIVVALLGAGAEVHKTYSTLYSAAQNGHAEIVTILLAAGADFNYGTNYGFKPLHIAACKGHLATVVALLNAGANVNARTYMGYTPLYLAAEKGYLEIVTILLATGANVNEKTCNVHATPLYIAAQNGHLEVVTILLAAGADIQYMDYGLRCLDLAHRNNFHDIVITLLKPFVLNYISRNAEKVTHNSFFRGNPNAHQFSQGAKALFDVLENKAEPDTLKPHYEAISLHKDELVTLFNYFYQHFPNSILATNPIESAAAPSNQSPTRRHSQ